MGVQGVPGQADTSEVTATLDSRRTRRSPARRPAPRPRPGRRRVLICDDEPDIREVYRFAFEHEGYEVVEAVDGLDSIDKAASFHPDLVVLDLAMPRCDGLAALPRILEAAPQATVVIVTAFSSVEAFSTGRRLGAAACIQKERFVPHIPDVWDRYCRRTPA